MEKYDWPEPKRRPDDSWYSENREVWFRNEKLGNVSNDKGSMFYLVSILALLQQQEKAAKITSDHVLALTTAVKSLTEKVDKLTQIVQFLPPSHGPEFDEASRRQAETMKK